MLQIRPALLTDLPAITEIYNDAVLHTTATFDTEIKTLDNRTQWFHLHDNMHPILIAEINNEVAGWASLSKWSERPAYDTTAEESVYISKEYRNKGTGKMLLQSIVEAGRQTGKMNLIARITTDNESSIYIHRWCGFEEVGVLKKVGIKFGRLLDVLIMQKVFQLHQ